MRTCFMCKLDLPESEFCKNASRPGGLNNKCKTCARKLWAEFRARNPGAVAESARRSRLKNLQRHKERKARHVRKPRSRFVDAQRTARSRGLDWSISFDAFVQHLGETCLYCGGALPEVGHGYDRVDNDHGYHPNNVVPCCTTCNMLRSTRLSHLEMLRLSPVLITIRLEREVRGEAWS